MQIIQNYEQVMTHYFSSIQSWHGYCRYIEKSWYEYVINGERAIKYLFLNLKNKIFIKGDKIFFKNLSSSTGSFTPLHSGHIMHGRVSFSWNTNESEYWKNGINIAWICPQVACNLLWRTCMFPGVTEKRRFAEKL